MRFAVVRAMRPVEVVEPLPFAQFRFEIDVSFVAERLVEFLAVRPMRSFDFAIQLRCAAFNIGMADAEIFNVPVEFGLELVPVVRSDFLDAEWKLFDHIVHELNRTSLIMFGEDP